MAVHYSLTVAEDGNGAITVTEDGRVNVYARSDPMFKLYVDLMRTQLLNEAGADGAAYVEKLFAALEDEDE